MEEKSISQAVIKRLPRYYRYLGDLLENGVDRISSSKLSELMNITASQIRQDLNNFGGFGQQGYGYNVPFLYNEIGKILALDKKHRVAIIGAGNLGMAIANYSDFKKRGFEVVAIFDKNKDKIGVNINGHIVKASSDIPTFYKETQFDIAAIAVPKERAIESAAGLVQLGVKAFWNFAPVDLNLPKDVVVENVHLTDSLMTLSYNMKNKSKKR